jgi:hypothetical protein
MEDWPRTNQSQSDDRIETKLTDCFRPEAGTKTTGYLF